MTVAELRKALEGLPDDMPVTVSTFGHAQWVGAAPKLSIVEIHMYDATTWQPKTARIAVLHESEISRSSGYLPQVLQVIA